MLIVVIIMRPLKHVHVFSNLFLQKPVEEQKLFFFYKDFFFFFRERVQMSRGEGKVQKYFDAQLGMPLGSVIRPDLFAFLTVFE